MSLWYTSRIINNPEDTAYLQSLLQKKPEEFFAFPLAWQEWFMTHPDWLALEGIQALLYDKILWLYARDNTESAEEIPALMALLLLSGLSYQEIMTQLSDLLHEKSSQKSS